MKVHYDLDNLPNFNGAIITIGSFDGVHLGHQKILRRLVELAREEGGTSVVITFDPHPRIVLKGPDSGLELLTTTAEKAKLLEENGIEHMVVVPFSKAFAQQSPKEYVEQFLLGKFQPSHIVIGYDHKFGQNRSGDVGMLRAYERAGDFRIIEIEAHEITDITVSSTKIRKALKAAEVKKAAQLLGHPFSITGEVVSGQAIGRKIGYPTANIAVSDPYKMVPPEGIYAVRCKHASGTYDGMLYIGNRPTLGGQGRSIEVNLFDFSGDIYGDQLSVDFVDYIRGDQKLDGLEALKARLAQDKIASLKILRPQKASTPRLNEHGAPHVAVVILNYNGRNYLEQFLPSVIQTNYPNFSIHIADNASTDDSVQWLKTHHSDLNLHLLEENHGFAQGYNLALKEIVADYYVLLNSDIEVTEDWISPVIEFMEKHPETGAAQPKICAFADKNIFEYAGAAGGWMDYLGYPFCRGRVFHITEKDEGQYDDTQEVVWATGAAMFIRPHLFHDLGGFDPYYFAHLEEIDLCWRIRRAGYGIFAITESKVFHVGGGTLSYLSPRKAYLNFRNSLFTLLKNEPSFKLVWLIPTRLLLDGVAGLLFLTEGKFAHIWAILCAHGRFYLRFFKVLGQRRRIKKLLENYDKKGDHIPVNPYQGSIVWDFYLRSKKTFQDIFSRHKLVEKKYQPVLENVADEK